MCTKCQEKPALTPQQIEAKIPSALCDVEMRLDSLRSLASCVLESLPVPQEGMDLAFYLNEASNLVAAMADILDLCREDVQKVYEQLKRVD
jgi:hypothetical protein